MAANNTAALAWIFNFIRSSWAGDSAITSAIPFDGILTAEHAVTRSIAPHWVRIMLAWSKKPHDHQHFATSAKPQRWPKTSSSVIFARNSTKLLILGQNWAER